jgi:hypothetical protein
VAGDPAEFGMQCLGQGAGVGKAVRVGDHGDGQGARIGQRLEVDQDIAARADTDRIAEVTADPPKLTDPAGPRT